jgi:hypothetical protein
MAFRTPILVATAGLFAIAAVLPASAQWSAKQRSEFTADCLAACRNNPKVPAANRPQCVDYCGCVIEEGERAFNEADYDEITRDFAAGKTTEKVRRLQGFTPVCNRRAFSPR